MVGERIYIGGLQPPRLSRRDIYRRLKALDQIEIESSSVEDDGNDNCDDSDSDDDSRPYLHITAISKNDSMSAFSIIYKQYHNVKWKGCKLVVELAKPHFLERLKQERNDRQSRTNVTATATKVDTDADLNRIPRRLRVRRKHGDIALHVDTSPWSTDSWSRFNQARMKLKKREEKHHINNLVNHSDDKLSASTGHFMHRAVHIRFQKEDDRSENLNSNDMNLGNNNNFGGTVTSSDESSSSSDDSESGSLQENQSNALREASRKLPSQRYEWSDDDSDSQSSNENTNNAEHKTYHWSTDEESIKDDDEYIISSSSIRDQQLTSAQFSQTDEFVAGFQDAATFSENIEHPDDHEPRVDDCFEGKDENQNVDLTGDVATNLNILSSIFPDMANARPVNPNSGDATDLDNDSTTQSTNAKNSNTNTAYNIMPRFDPSEECSKKYIIESENAKENEGNNDPTKDVSMEEQSDNEDMIDDGDEKTDHEKPQLEENLKSQSVSGIYEQDKLENVFRDARDAWSAEDSKATITSTLMKKKSPEDSDTNTFQFGFSFDDKNKEAEIPKESFSFSFNVPNQSEREVKSTSASNDLAMTQKDSNLIQTETSSSSKEDSEAVNGDSVDKEAPNNVSTREKGLTLPDHDLQKYVENFFACNNGLRIIENPQQFMNDDKERIAWNNERQTLTLDWKRKRKYATTRIQKRMKARSR